MSGSRFARHVLPLCVGAGGGRLRGLDRAPVSLRGAQPPHHGGGRRPIPTAVAAIGPPAAGYSARAGKQGAASDGLSLAADGSSAGTIAGRLERVRGPGTGAASVGGSVCRVFWVPPCRGVHGAVPSRVFAVAASSGAGLGRRPFPRPVVGEVTNQDV